MIDPARGNGQENAWAEVLALLPELEAGTPGAILHLRREAHRGGLVSSFDWPSWMISRGRRLTGDHDAIAQATLEECRRLLVVHIRRDRFVEGHLEASIQNGEVPAILRRAGELTGI
jgi:hypothetical protein